MMYEMPPEIWTHTQRSILVDHMKQEAREALEEYLEEPTQSHWQIVIDRMAEVCAAKANR